MRLAVRLSLRQCKGVNHWIIILLKSCFSLIYFFSLYCFHFPKHVQHVRLHFIRRWGCFSLQHALPRDRARPGPLALNEASSRERRGAGAAGEVKGSGGRDLACCGRVWDSVRIIPMPLVNNKVGDDCAASGDKTLADGKALVDSLIKVSRSRLLFMLLCLKLMLWPSSSVSGSTKNNKVFVKLF